MVRDASAWPFIGRADELRRLRDALEAARGGRPSVTIVGGDAGVGKTRLLAEFLAGVGDDVTVTWGGCMPLGERGLPLAPVVQVLRDLTQRGELPDPVPPALERLMPGATASPAPRSAGQPRLFRAFVELLEGIATRRPAVLVLEDLQWADRSTRELLSFIAYNLRDQRLFVLGSFRSDDLHADHPLVPDLAEWRRNPYVDRIDLRPFDALETAEHVADLLGEGAAPELVEAVVARTEGNPFFIEELVAARSAGGGPMPESLRELMVVRAGSVDAQAKRVLRLAAAAAGRIDEATLAAVGDMSSVEVDAALAALVARRLLVVDGDAYRFRHALLREAVHDDLTPRERAEAHRAYAQVLVERPDLGQPGSAAATAELAFHWGEAGDRPRALAAWVRAAEAAEGVLAYAEAHGDLEQVLGLWDEVPGAETLVGAPRLDILRRAAENAFLAGESTRAVELAQQAVALLDADAEPMAAAMLHGRLARYVWDTPRQHEATAIYRRAVELAPAEPSAERADLLATLAGHLMVLGRYDESRRVSEEALEMARAAGATHAEYMTLDTLGTIVCTEEDVDAGLALVERARAMAEEAGDSFEHMRAVWNLYANTFSAARWEEALEVFDVVRDVFPRLGQGHLVLELQLSAADCLMRLGRWDEAEEMIADAQRRQRPGTPPIRLAELDIARGRFDDARASLEGRRAEEAVVAQEQRGWPPCWLAELACWEERPASARPWIREGLSMVADLDESLAIAYLCAVGLRGEADLAERERARGRAAEADEAVRVGLEHLERARALMSRPGPPDGWKREVGALVLQCEAEARRAAGEASPDAWAEAVAAWEALAMSYHAAYCRWRLAEAHLAIDDRGAAREALERAHEVAVSLRAEPLREALGRLGRRARIDLGEPSPVPQFASLTPREREVLALVAAGQSNRQIARALFISEKTASVHVSNILSKLEVSSRGEAAALAHREGVLD
jgi:DNA-binding CsgD family transcriptional regulator/tetratricopeptide (TPR) repeat protein